jgi:hypothetical protein
VASPLIRAEIASAIETFRFEEAAMRALLRGPTGAVARNLVQRAIRVETAAKSSMGQEAPPSSPGHPPAVVTGRLRGSITWRIGEDALGLYADIGSAVEYALYLEEGTVNMAPRPFLKPALEAARI